MKVLIVDDEPLARRKLRRLLGAEADVEITGEIGSGQEAIEALTSSRPDVVFLDVQMPEVDGFAVLRAIGDRRPPVVVFVTAFDEHAVRAFEVQALDYLLKPFDRQRFRATLERARVHLEIGGQRRELTSRLLTAIEATQRPPARPEHLLVRSGAGVELVRIDDIDRLEAAANYVQIHVGPRVHSQRATLRQLLEQLDPARFVRIHRSHIVQLARIHRLDPLFNGDMTVTMLDGTELTLTRTYRDRVFAMWGSR